MLILREKDIIVKITCVEDRFDFNLVYKNNQSTIRDRKEVSAEIDAFQLDMVTLENYISYKSKNLTVFLGKYTFFSLNCLLALLAEIFFVKMISDDDTEYFVSEKEQTD